jgi:signal transduction histidine kinase
MNDCLIIAENERRFMAQELHDHVIQTLLQMNMQVGICKRYLELGYTDETTTELDSLEAQVSLASEQVRELIADLRAPLDDEGTFAGMLQKQIEIHQERSGPLVILSEVPPVNIAGEKLLAVARILQEILLNIRKHAWAREVKIDLEANQDKLTMTVTDDGSGFDAALIPNPLATKGGAGLVNLQIRTAAIGGQFDITSQPNHGTTVTVTVPL